MQTELATNPVEAAPPAPEVAPTPPVENLELDPTAEAQPEGQEPAQLDDFEEVDYEGNKYKVPKAIAPALLRQADYTKKTQEVAELRKATEAEKARLADEAKGFQEDRAEHVQAFAMWQQLEQFKNVNWNQLQNEDFIEYQKLVNQYTMLRDAHRDVVGKLQMKQQQRASQATAQAATLREQTRMQLAKEIPNWSPKAEQDLTTYALKHGYKAEEVKAALDSDARPFKFLHKAFLYDQLVEKQRLKAAAQQPAEPVKPVGNGRVPPLGITDNLSIDTWMDRRNKDAAKRA